MTSIKQFINFKHQLTCFVELIHFCNALHRTGQNARAPCVSAHFMNASSPDSLAGKRPSLKNMSRDCRTCLNCTTAVVSSIIPVYCLASSFACERRQRDKLRSILKLSEREIFSIFCGFLNLFIFCYLAL